MNMKSFKDYLTEGKKIYCFKVKVAGDLPEGFNDKLKMAMERFSVVKIGSGKRSPITEAPADFPTMKNTHVTVFDVDVNYPTVPTALAEYIAQSTGMPHHCVKVRNANDPEESFQSAAPEEATDLLVDSQLEDVDGSQKAVGQNRVMDLLKELDKFNAERKANTVKTVAKPGKEMSDPEFEGPKDGAASPVGSKAVKRK